MPRVKGLAFRSLLEALSKLQSESVVEQVRRELAPDLAQKLNPVLASSWYAIGDYAALWRTIQRVTGNRPDFPRLMGRKCVEQDLKMVHKLAMAALTVPTVMTIASRLFGTYYDTGRSEAIRQPDGSVQVQLTGCLGFSEIMWTEIRGASECFAEQASKQSAYSELLDGGQDGDAWMKLVVHWAA